VQRFAGELRFTAWYSGFRAPPTTREELFDVVCTCSDLPSPTVNILDGGLSDHHLLRRSSHLCRPAPVYTTSVRRCWRSFDPDTFWADLLTSALCEVQSYSDLDSDSLASLYDSTITELLDRQVPMQSVTCRRRPSSLWFDDECRGAKRKVRRLERAARREGPLLSPRCRPLPRGALNVVHTSTYYSENNARTRPNASTPTSHTRVVCGGPSTNCWVAVVLGHPTSMLQTFIDTLMTKLSESALLLPAQIHHFSRSARQAAHSKIFILSRQLMSRHLCVHFLISSVLPIHSRLGC